MYDFGNFRIDESEQRLILKQHVIPIQPKTFDTLVALVKLTLEKGKDGLITKDELMNLVWPDASVEEGNLADAISNLRFALHDDPQRPKYIATAHKRGYRFLAEITVSERMDNVETAHPVSEYEEKLAEAISSANLAKGEAEQHKKSSAYERARANDNERRIEELTAARDEASREIEQHKTTRIKTKRWIFVGAGFVALTLLGAFLTGRSVSHPASRSGAPARLSLPLPNLKDPSSFAISRDGSLIAFSATSMEGARFLYIRAMAGDSLVRIEGTEGGSNPFWSPDARQIGFFADDKLKTIDRDGGVPRVLWRASRPGGGTWNSDDVVVFAPQISGELFKIDLKSQNRVPEPVTKIENHEAGHLWPSFLPDNEHFLFIARMTGNAKLRSIRIGSVRSMWTKPVLDGVDSNAVYIPGADKTGRLLFMEGETLIAQPFRTDVFQVSGAQSRIASNVGYLDFLSRGEFAASYKGDVLFGPSSRHRSRLVWYSRSGDQLNQVGQLGYHLQHSISPNGQEVAVDRLNTALGTYDIWIENLLSGRARKITSDRLDDYSASWSPDGTKLIYSCYASGSTSRSNYANLCERLADGSGPERMLHPDLETQIPTDWSKDGKYVAFYVRDSRANKGDPQRVIQMLEMDGNVTTPFPACDCDEWQAEFSPNVKWIAYTSDVSGRKEVYIRPFPFRNGVTIPVSKDGGSMPHWSSDGRELFYVSSDQNLVTVAFNEKSRATAQPVKLFHASFERPGTVVYSYAVNSDSSRFLARSTIDGEASSPATVLLNWLSPDLNRLN